MGLVNVEKVEAQEQHEKFLSRIEQYGNNKLFIKNQWIADYVRLRMIAIKI